MPLSTYQKNVFINCPFDPGFRTLLEAIVFTVHDCGFVARSALEADDGSQVRITKIYRIISDCAFGVHDLSRTELDAEHSLPRFNMPLELGIFLGAKRFGDDVQQEKNCLILDRERFRCIAPVRPAISVESRARRSNASSNSLSASGWKRGQVTSAGRAPSGSQLLPLIIG